MDLQSIAAVVDHVRIDEAGNEAFADEGFSKTFGEGGGAIGGGFGFGGCGHASPMVTAVFEGHWKIENGNWKMVPADTVVRHQG